MPLIHHPAALAGHVGGNLGNGYLQADVAKHADIPNNHQQSLPTN
jgi:hypothetical protein